MMKSKRSSWQKKAFNQDAWQKETKQQKEDKEEWKSIRGVKKKKNNYEKWGVF